MTTKHKRITAVAAVAATLGVISYLFITIPTGVKGFYDSSGQKDKASYLGVKASEDSLIAWHQKNGDNSIDAYGFDSKIKSSANWPSMASYIKRESKAGIKVFGIPYSSSSPTSSIQAYNVAQPNDSSRIKAVKSEIEPYNYINKDSAYSAFYITIRTVYNWAVKQNPRVETACYMGWPKAACWDSILNNTDRTFLHDYIPSSNMSGAGLYSYLKSRLITMANLWAAKHPNDNSKYNVVVIFSDEAAYGGTYFKTHSWEQPLSDLLAYINTSGDSIVKARIQFGGRQIFNSQLGRITRS